MSTRPSLARELNTRLASAMRHEWLILDHLILTKTIFGRSARHTDARTCDNDNDWEHGKGVKPTFGMQEEAHGAITRSYFKGLKAKSLIEISDLANGGVRIGAYDTTSLSTRNRLIIYSMILSSWASTHTICTRSADTSLPTAHIGHRSSSTSTARRTSFDPAHGPPTMRFTCSTAVTTVR